MGEFSTEGLSKRVSGLVGRVQQAVTQETGEMHDERLIEESMRQCVANKLDRLEEGMLEMFTTPGRPEFDEMAAYLESHAAHSKAAVEIEEMVHVAEEYGDASVFDGFRPYSRTKMAAMIEYLTAKGNYVYKTSLNKLLFYSDLTAFYLQNHGISGAVYYNRRYGPVADPAEPTLRELIAEGVVAVDPRTQTLSAAAAPHAQILTDDERKVLDWVADTYGKLGASEISDLSHREMAYKYTEPNETIAYAYAKFLRHLPPKDLLGASK
jgi:uncharacterized phage-associated protein